MKRKNTILRIVSSIRLFLFRSIFGYLITKPDHKRGKVVIIITGRRAAKAKAWLVMSVGHKELK